MAQASATKEFTSFIGGLITEASPLTFPDNASLDEDNFDIIRDGSRRRRLGVDYEQNFLLKLTGKGQTQISDNALSSFLWENVGDDPSVSIIVVQVGSDLWFFDAFTLSVSATPLNGGNSVCIAGDTKDRIQATNVFGKLVLVNNQKGFFVLTYDKDTDTINAESRILLVRDIWGVEDGYATNERPKTLTQEHEYNLLNQGWGVDNPDSASRLYDSFFTSLSEYPSNADLVFTGKDASDEDKFNPKLIKRHYSGTTPAGKGFFTLEAFRRGSSRRSAMAKRVFTHNSSDITGDPFAIEKFLPVNTAQFPTIPISGPFGFSTQFSFIGLINPTFSSSSLPLDTSAGGLKTVASFAGRVWYAGAQTNIEDGDLRSPNLGGYVFFSQVIENDQKMGLCHQDGDPTSEDTPDPLDSDGGAIKIPEASNIQRIIPLANSIVVFASNGVWEISGGENPFSAVNFQVNKVTASGAISPDSVVAIDSNLIYWSKGGIYVLTVNEATGLLSPQNLSETTIQSFYNDISSSAKKFSKGIYDISARKVRWLYTDDTTFNGTAFTSKYNRELIFDTVLNAFYTATIQELATDSPFIAGSYLSPEENTVNVNDTVLAGTDEVLAGTETVIIIDEVAGNGQSRTKYLTFKPAADYGFTFSFQRDEDFLDWKSDDTVGKDANALLLTGYEILKDTQRQKQAVYLTTHFRRTEETFVEVDGDLVPGQQSSCKIQAQWDFADSAASGKFGTEFQAYRLRRNFIPTGVGDPFDYGQTVITTKNKIRGRGKSLSLLFKTEPGKDLHIYGWGILFTGSSDV